MASLHRAGPLTPPLHAAGGWRARMLGARGLAQRSPLGAHSASSDAAAEDTPEHADSPVKPPRAPPPGLGKFIAAFAVFGLAGNSFGAQRASAHVCANPCG